VDGNTGGRSQSDNYRFVVDDPVSAHIAQLDKYTDSDMHDVLAYLQTLK